jgi:hypothetical protein
VRQIPLRGKSGEGLFVLVDDGDYESLAQYRWFLSTHGYAYRNGSRRDPGGKKHIEMHRMLVGLKRGDKRKVDHEDRIRLNNQRSNLRIATAAQNQHNRSGWGKTSKYRGVWWFPNYQKWRAEVRLNYKKHFLGYFEREEDAARAASEFRAKHMPFSEDARVLGQKLAG